MHRSRRFGKHLRGLRNPSKGRGLEGPTDPRNGDGGWNSLGIIILPEPRAACSGCSAMRAAGELASAAGDAWQLGQDLIDRPLEAAEVRIAGVVPYIDPQQLQAMTAAFMTDRRCRSQSPPAALAALIVHQSHQRAP